jgi:iron complex outermembrane receptor protein/vitamin B12 transporter
LRAAWRAAFFSILLFGFSLAPARAVVVRGTVTDSLGAAVPGARVELVQGKQVVASTLSGADGSFEILSTARGRFLLITSATTFAPGIDGDFYGGQTDVLTRKLVLSPAAVHAEITVTATGTPTPVQQTASAVTLIGQQDLATRVDAVDAMRQSPGVAVVQTGQYGGVTSLFVRGGNSDANKVLVDGIPAEDVGGRFDFGTVSTTGLAGLELHRDPDSVLYGSDAVAAVVSLTTPRGMATRPQIDFAGDGGNFHTYRNEVQLSGARQRLDYLAAFSRFNSSNALPDDEYHVATSAANLGYSLGANTQARFTLRNQVSAGGLPGAHDFFGISEARKQSDQDLYSGLTLENRIEAGWHNLVRYGIARKREQDEQFHPVGEFLVYDQFGDGAYFGNQVTIRGANGYTGTGRAAIVYNDLYPVAHYQDSNRDELYYQTDYTFPKRITGLFGFRYENERGSYLSNGLFGSDETIQRTNYEYTLQFSGDVKSRFFYSLGGALEKNHLYGTAGTPRIGLAYVPVRSSRKWFHGTRLRANVATGVQEPSLAIEFSSLYSELLAAGDTADVAAYHVTPIGAPRSRSYDAGVDQNIRGDKLVLKLGYFHNQFSHQFDFVDAGTLKAVFGIDTSTAHLYGAEVNSLAYRGQGFESEVQWQALPRLFVRGGYTFLAAVVEQSFSTDAAYNGTATTNPNLPGVAIGSSYPLVGARPFRRPPHTGYFTVQYVGSRFGAALQGALASRSDDSTFLSYSDENGDNSLLLPNRDLDFGYAKLDLNATYNVSRRTTTYVQLGNLLSQQHIGPIGYPALPFTVRAGMKFRFGGD